MIGADSWATLGDGAQIRTIEQLTERKTDIVGEQFIIAGADYVGHGQRFCDVVSKMYNGGAFKDKPPMDIARLLSEGGVNDFAQTITAPQL